MSPAAGAQDDGPDRVAREAVLPQVTPGHGESAVLDTSSTEAQPRALGPDTASGSLPPDGPGPLPDPSASPEDPVWAEDGDRGYTVGRFVSESLLAVAILAVGLLAIWLLVPDGDTTSAASAPPVARPTSVPRTTFPPVVTEPVVAPDAVVLSGSSLPEGSIEGALGRLGRNATVMAVAGAGFSSTVSTGGRPLVERLPEQLDAQTDLLVLQGGEADNVAGPGELEAALTTMLDTAAATAPQAPIVLIGPIPAGEPPASMLTVNATIASVAQQRGVAFIDAIAAGWRSDQDLTEQLTAALAAVLPAPAG